MSHNCSMNLRTIVLTSQTLAALTEIGTLKILSKSCGQELGDGDVFSSPKRFSFWDWHFLRFCTTLRWICCLMEEGPLIFKMCHHL
ncbi:uncharacterized protein LOC141591228 isoform X2 [Silene latifolia]